MKIKYFDEERDDWFEVLVIDFAGIVIKQGVPSFIAAGIDGSIPIKDAMLIVDH